MSERPSDPPSPSEPELDRREFLQAGALAAVARDGTRDELFMPEEHWRERMQPPDDGKRYGWVLDVRRCFGCHGCEVACKAENDVPRGSYIRQTIYVDELDPDCELRELVLHRPPPVRA